MAPGLLWLILLSPLIASIIITVLTRKSGRLSALISVGAILLSFFLSLGPLAHILAEPQAPPTEYFWYWLNLPTLQVKMGILIDPLSVVMLLVVTGVGSLIHIYSM